MTLVRRPLTRAEGAAFTWLVAQAGLALLWPFGTGSPFGGRVGIALPVAGLCVAGAVLVPAAPRLVAVAGGWGACVVLVLVVPHNLVMQVAFGQPVEAPLVFAFVGGLLCGLAADARRVRTGRGCRVCGRTRPVARRPDGTLVAPRWARVAVGVAVFVPLAGFTLQHWSWALGVPLGTTRAGEMSGTIAVSLFVLGAVPAVGAVLTAGLARGWSQRFPRWVPGLAGRRVPAALAITPPLVAGLLVGQYGALMTRCVAFGLTPACDPGGAGEAALAGQWAFTATYPVFLVWGAALLVATLGFRATTRPCPVCL
ncbi:hypothetical protein GCM10027258_09010 [Amycolatopsis stemonae]